MSRIDKALRVWEDSFGVDRSDAEIPPSAAGSTLNDYVREGHSSPPRLAERPRRDAEPSAAPVHRIRPAPATPKVDADLEARLVTGKVSPVSLEQYRRLAATLHEAQAEGGLKTVMLTSALPHEGKTLTSVNLALTLSDSYARRVLLIDADLRWPSVHTLLGVPNTRGLIEVLASRDADLPVLKVSERLSVLTAGCPGATPLAGLSSPQMGTLIEECGRRFDWVLLDTPPIGLLPDAQLLARLVGAVILVIGAGSTSAATVERAVTEIGPERIIGVVMNRVERHRVSEADCYDRYKSTSE